MQRPNWSEECSRWKPPLKLGLSSTGTIWRKFGTIQFTTNLECRPKNIPHYWLKLLWIQRKIEKLWLRLCLRCSTFLVSMFLKLQFSHCTRQEGQQVLLLIQEMESLTQSLSMKGMLSHMPFNELCLRVNTSQSISANFWKIKVTVSQHLLTSK